MKKISAKILSYLIEKNNIKPNKCQINASSIIDSFISKKNKFLNLDFLKKKKLGIYIYGSVGVGKSILLKALNVVYPNSEILHFNDLIFHLQVKDERSVKFVNNLRKTKLILVDEFFINNLTNLILFKEFLSVIIKYKIPIVMTSNKKLSQIYNDPINSELCKEIRKDLTNLFLTIKIKSKVDYRVSEHVNHDFFFIKKKNSNLKQNLIIKQLAISSISREVKFKRRGNEFKLNNVYGNLVDMKFNYFFNKNLVFQDYEILSKKIKIFIIRDLKRMDENSKNLLSRFISFVDVIYENKNILSISTNVELDKIYLGKTNLDEFKRTISRLKEMGANTYINKNLNMLLKKD
ncbi:MAG: cell division protein ZapE [Pseudomonadota bacterium]|nr:cell division protein ZapE [Pseudomonadota bacterium]